MLGLRTAAADVPPAALTISPGSLSVDGKLKRDGMVSTFPELSLFDVVESALAFGRALVRALVRRDRTQGGNLRLAAFRRDLRAVGDSLREVRRQDSRINPAPESYRAFAHQAARRRSPRPARSATPRGSATRSAGARSCPASISARRSSAEIASSSAPPLETFCLDRTTGELLWRRSTPRATSVVTPAGIARIAADGAIALHDFASGEVTLRTWIAPRVARPVRRRGRQHRRAPEAPHRDRGRQATSSPSTSRAARPAGATRGAARARSASSASASSSTSPRATARSPPSTSRPAPSCGASRDRLRFCSAPTVDHETLFAVAGGVSSAATLHAIDPVLGPRVLERAHPLVAVHASRARRSSPPSSVTVAVRDRRGLRLSAFDRETGAPLFHTETPVAPVGTSWLAVDDLLVGNTPTGRARRRRRLDRHAPLEADARPRGLDSDSPRKLEPVLRSGALFVPHIDVHVFRPSDGAHLGSVGPCDAIPNLLRVDERCDVYVAEESGHMVAFGAGPRLSLVR